MNDRTIDGKKSLHLEEIQSDWHQQGRDKGYKSKLKPEDIEVKFIKGNPPEGADPRNYPGYWESFDKQGNMISRHGGNRPEDVVRQEAITLRSKEGVPDAPFKKTWHELALKRAIREAAENGYERLSWTPGEAQAARYDLSKQINLLSGMKEPNGKYNIYLEGKDGRPLFSDQNGFSYNGQKSVTVEELENLVGKEVAKKITEGKPNKEGWVDVRDKDLKIGGEGMKGFYDQIIPKSVEKIAKEFGVKVKKDNLPVNEKQIEKLWKEFENTKPDEIATKEHKKDWDEMVEARRRLQPLIDDRNRELNNVEYEIVKKDWDEINKALDQIHEQMVEDTLRRKEKELKGESIFYIDIPPSMRQSIVGKGFPLFSQTPTLTPIDFEPEFEEEIK